MLYNLMAESDALKPSVCFQKMCQVMVNEGLNKQQVEDFRLILHMLVLESSRHNIEVNINHKVDVLSDTFYTKRQARHGY